MVHALNRLSRYYQKLRSVGVSRCVRAFNYRVQRSIFIKKMRRVRRVDQIPQPIQVKPQRLEFLEELAQKTDRHAVIKQADQYMAGQYDVLGSGDQLFTKMPWHQDFRLDNEDPQADFQFDPHQFYADVTIKAGNGKSISKDIKLPWELSRFQHLPVLALAYKLTGDERYAQCAKTQIIDWLENNPYLHGVNWVSPMEVGIRATNWIVAWQSLQKPLQKDEQFQGRFVGSLRDHMRYLEGNWEFYDGRTSNHYLSNLVGYFYLCWFFDDTEKADWCYRELVRELDWQIFDEGTSYEGSTRYHQLVTEFAVHTILLSREMGINVEERLLEKLDRMLMFLDWCTPTAGGGGGCNW